MKRLARILLNAATTVSLFLCLAAVGLWLRSYSVAETFTWHAEDDWRRARYAYWARGRLALVMCLETMTSRQMEAANLMAPPVPPGIQYRRAVADSRRQRPDDLDRSWSSFRPTIDRAWGGFRYRDGRVFSLTARQWVVPFWAPVTLLAPLTALAIARLVRRVRRWRAAPGLCPACGYDLRATPERCPECGTVQTAT